MNMRALCIVTLAAAAASAQAPDTRPAFEAAFLKPNMTASTGSSSNSTKGQIVIVNQSLKRLVERAFNVKPFQVTGPEWLEDARFDITAKYPEGSKNEDRPAMLKTLLEDRFKLATHGETKELPGYALVVAKSGLKMKAVEADDSQSGTSSNSSNHSLSLRVTSISIAEFANFLARRLGSAVVDTTRLEGRYTFELHWLLDDSNGGSADAGAAEFAAIQEAIGTLGLRLQAQKVPVRIVVVDHAERVPTGN